MTDTPHAPVSVRWARFRFQVVGSLFASPPEPGELGRLLDELAARTYQHPTRPREQLRIGRSTIERWYYTARSAEQDPIGALARKVHAHAGTHKTISTTLADVIAKQHREHPSWSISLHYDNLVTLATSESALAPLPSLQTVRRFMKGRGLFKRKKPRKRRPDDVSSEGTAFEPRERRSFEVGHVHALWHADFHQGSRKVVDQHGVWSTPILLGFLDDCSRIACHLQWYLAEDAEAFVHGLMQAIQKRGLPRGLLTDNGAAMRASEVVEGLERLSITHYKTLPYCPEQNGKQESFWGRVEGRLMAMLEGDPELTLQKLNEATQAWVELEYHRQRHSELRTTPLERMLEGPSVARKSPSSDALRRAFRTQVVRTQRRSDGTITVAGVRFELPTRYRVLGRPVVRYARWDLSSVDLVDARHETHLATLLPLDKLKNADARRRVVTPTEPDTTTTPSAPVGVAPRLRALIAEYAATGLPPAYVPLHEYDDPTESNPESEAP